MKKELFEEILLRKSYQELHPDELREITALDATGPIHIHAAEQTREVEECVAWSGARPVAWLLANIGERRLMAAGGMTMGFCLLVIALRMPWPIEFANFVIMGFGFYLLHGCIQVYVTELAPTARGSATAAHSMFFFLGQATGPVGSTALASTLCCSSARSLSP